MDLHLASVRCQLSEFNWLFHDGCEQLLDGLVAFEGDPNQNGCRSQCSNGGFFGLQRGTDARTVKLQYNDGGGSFPCHYDNPGNVLTRHNCAVAIVIPMFAKWERLW